MRKVLQRLALIPLLLAMLFSVTACTGATGIVGAVANKKVMHTQGSDGDGSGCDQSAGGGTISGSENMQKIFNYFVTSGLSKEAAAGFLGNMFSESGGNPAATQTSSGWGWDVPVPDLSGWGLIQWTAGRHDAVRKYVTDKGSKSLYVSDIKSLSQEDQDKLLKLELDYLMTELNGPYKASTLDPVKAATTAEQASEIITKTYEVPGNPGHEIPVRQKQAAEYLSKYGTDVPTKDAPSTLNTTCTGSAQTGQAKDIDIGDDPKPTKNGEYTGHYLFEVPPQTAENGYGTGQCTDWAYQRRKALGHPVGTQWGNGGSWGNAAKNAGYKNVQHTTPHVGDLVSFLPGTHGMDPVYGHIAVVEKVWDDGSFVYSEANDRGVKGGGTGHVTTRTFFGGDIDDSMTFIGND